MVIDKAVRTGCLIVLFFVFLAWAIVIGIGYLVFHTALGLL